MLFHSVEFLVFAGVFFALWPLAVARPVARWALITVASFVFYGWHEPWFLLLLAANGLVDFAAALAIERWPHRRRAWLALSLGANLASLAAFKYSAFASRNLDSVLAWMGASTRLSPELPAALLALPAGISFYTFQSMSYTLDVYRGELRATRSLTKYFAFLSLFPQLVAGPIVRASELLPQLDRDRPATEAERWSGTVLIIGGFAKKALVADNLAPTVNAAFSAQTPSTSFTYWWLVVSLFALQIYFDFSGYSDIARGLARWMGYDFAVNFDHPYRALGLRDFWRRWHVSLSTWFRDYVYIPLGGSRHGKARELAHLWVTLLLSGLWHGASWTFVVWGALHAGALSFERLTRWTDRVRAWPLGSSLVWGVTLAQVLLAWVFFRAGTLSQATDIVSAMFSMHRMDLADLPSSTPLAFAAAGVLYEAGAFAALGRGLDRLGRGRRVAEPLLLACVVVATLFLRGPGSAFLYFQF